MTTLVAPTTTSPSFEEDLAEIIKFRDETTPSSCDGLSRDRYCVLSEVLPPEACRDSVERLWDFFEDITNGSRVKRSDPTTWHATGNNYPPENGLFENFGAGWLLGNIREILASKVYEPLFSTRELHSSKEGFRLVLPPTTTTNIDNTAASSLTKRFLTPYCSSDSKDHRQKEKDEPPFYGFRSLAVLSGSLRCRLCFGSSEDDEEAPSKEVSLSRGDVLLFRSDVRVTEEYYCSITDDDDENSSRTHSYDDVPSVMYCTMKPAAALSKRASNRRVEAYKQRQTGTPRIDDEEEAWTDPCVVPGHLRCYFRTSPPLLTKRQAELYGLLPYASDDWEKELERATVRGICFADGCYDALPQKVERECTAVSVRLTSTDPNVLCGQDKYLGGMASPDGKYVYGVPGTSKRVLRISTETGVMDCIGPSYNGKFKWLRGVEIPPSVTNNHPGYPDGCCIALPCNSLSFLKVNPAIDDDNDSSSTASPTPPPAVYTFGQKVLEEECGGVNGWYYHGGNLASNGWIYCIPANAPRVVKVHPVTDEVVGIGPNLGEGKQKWYGGIVGSDGCVYGIPHNARAVLKINPETDGVALLEGTDKPLPIGNWKWHGGLAAGDKIIGFPNNSSEILVVHCKNQTVYTIEGGDILEASGRHRVPRDGRYKYLGGALARGGRFAYLFPCDAERVLRIDCETEELALVGPCLLDGENKFQNGFCSEADGCLYGIPQRATGVLRVTPGDGSDDEDHVDVIPCGEDMVGIKDKFEGGVLGPSDGAIYCIPLKAKACVKIIPAGRPANK